MADGIELATAYVSLSTSARGLRKEIDKELGASVAGGDKVGRSLGDRVSSGFGKAVKVGFAGAAGILGVSLVKGFGRLSAIENAQAKLKGLGNSAADVEKIMDNALASVKGTAFGLDAAATTAAGAVAAGIKPGKELEGVLKSVANSSAAAGVGMEEMGGIYNKVASLGKAQNDSLQQVADKGIPIYQALAENLGVTTEEVFKMASAGKIGFKDFEKAMTDASGTVADEMGKTTTGALSNLWAALGRFGAGLLKDIYPLIGPIFGSLTDWLDKAGDKVGPLVEWLSGKFVGAMEAGKAAVSGLVDGWRDGEGVAGRFRDVIDKIAEGIDAVVQVFRKEGTGALAKFLDVPQDHAIIGLLQSIRDFVTDTLPSGFEQLKDIIEGTFSVLSGGTTGQLASALDIPQGHAIIGTLWTVRELVISAFTWIRDVAIPTVIDFGRWLLRNREALLAVAAGVLAGVAAFKAFMFIRTVVTALKTARAAILAFNAALWANPIGIVVAAIGVLVGALVYLYRNNETARRIMDAAWEGIKNAISTVVDWFRNTAWPWMRDAFQWIGDKATWLWKNIITPAWEGIKAAVSASVTWIKDTAWPWIRDTFNNVRDKAEWLRDKAEDAWEGISGAVSTAWDKAKGIIASFKSGLDDLKTKFSRVKDGIGQIWQGIVATIGEPINIVLRFINNSLIAGMNWLFDKIPGVSLSIPNIPLVPIPSGNPGRRSGGGGGGAVWAANGGVLPGYSPGVDNYHFRGNAFDLHLAGGEAIMRPEWTRAIGADRIHAMNKAARTGGVSGVRKSLGFASGGIFEPRTGGPLDGVWDSIKGIGSLLKDLISDPVGFVKEKVKGWLGGIGDSWPAQAFLGAADTMIDGLGNWVKEKLSFGGGDGAPGGAPMPWQSIWAIVKALIPDAVMTSNYRPGAKTAGYGTTSLHALGRAVDFASPHMVADTILLSMAKNWTELIHTPAGRFQRNRGGGSTFNAVTRANHYDHVHVGASKGGLLPQVFDQGGILKPGQTAVNLSSKPEAVFTHDQFRDLKTDPRELAEAVRSALTGATMRGRLDRNSLAVTIVDVQRNEGRRMVQA